MSPTELLEQIVRALETHPEWRLPFLRALGLEGLLPLPEKLEIYRREDQERFDRLENALTQLAAGMEELRQVVQRLTIGQEELRAGQEALRAEMRQEIETLKVGQEQLRAGQEALRAEMRQEIETLKAGQEQLRAGQEELRAGQEALRAEMRQEIETLKAGQEQLRAEMHREIGRLDERYNQLREVVNGILKDLAVLKGSDRERYYRERAPAIFGLHLRKVRLLDMGDLLDEIATRIQLSPEEEKELLSADGIFYALKKTTREPIYVVLEVSWVVDSNDLERVLRRAQILQRAGYPAVPVLGGVEVVDEVKQAAQAGQVVLVSDGQMIGEALLA
jgi:predicted  nucleic acid-binding Zn-ribbon protein